MAIKINEFCGRYYRSETGAVLDRANDSQDSSDMSHVALNKLHFKLRFGINRNHPLYNTESASLNEIASHGLIFPSNNTYRDTCGSFLDFCHRERINIKPYHVETNDLLEMWLGYSGKSAFILSENMLPTQLLPQEFFDRVRIIAPSDDVYYMDYYMVYNKKCASPATIAVVDVLSEYLN
jgi:hypothetical protein